MGWGYDLSSGSGSRARQPGGFQDRRHAAGHRQRAAGYALEAGRMSSPEELTFVAGRLLRSIALVLDLVRPIGFGRYLAVNTGVQASSADLGAVRSTAFRLLIDGPTSVALWHRPPGARALEISARASANPPLSPRACRRIRHCAIRHRRNGRRTAIDMYRCDPRRAPGPVGPAAVPPAIEFGQTSFTRCHSMILLIETASRRSFSAPALIGVFVRKTSTRE